MSAFYGSKAELPSRSALVPLWFLLQWGKLPHNIDKNMSTADGSKASGVQQSRTKRNGAERKNQSGMEQSDAECGAARSGAKRSRAKRKDLHCVQSDAERSEAKPPAGDIVAKSQ